MDRDLHVCPRCGKLNNASAGSCMNCGRNFSNLDNVLVALFSPVLHYLAWPAALAYGLYWVGTKLLSAVTTVDPIMIVACAYTLVALLLVIRYFTVYSHIVAGTLD